jgi:hypothetical protein
MRDIDWYLLAGIGWATWEAISAHEKIKRLQDQLLVIARRQNGGDMW